ncbi:hypothetical protein F0562_014975 [Nyssa sinensis]|uniref:Retrotransposon gag domain-containing protein n=1 Tax=Nyssa sinensis TaxID=561372 RepID=A0A5J4ZPD2_9ASTE|nr:hypothetical protein F0562_014975 [Nyssa sinensis]
MQKRRAQGLCFNCNDRFTAGHKCNGPQLLLLEGPTGADTVTCEDVTEELPVDDGHEELPEPEISLHALTGWSTPKTMRVIAKIGHLEAVVFIDSGSTHNFISDKVANLLHLPVVPTEPFTVRVANGNKLHCQGRFEHVHVLLQGPVVCNWKKMTMEFTWENQVRRLQGTDANSIQSASLKAVAKELRQGSSMFAICLHSLEEVPRQANHPDMQQLLENYTDIF